MLIGFKKKAAPHMLTKACAKNASPFQQSCPGASNCEIKIQESGLWYSHSFCTTTTLTCLQSIAYPNVISKNLSNSTCTRDLKPWNPISKVSQSPSSSWICSKATFVWFMKAICFFDILMWRWSNKITRKVGHCLFFLLFFGAVIFG